MTWGELKKQVEEYGFFNDDTDVMIYNGLYCETDKELYFDIKDRIVLSEKDYKMWEQIESSKYGKKSNTRKVRKIFK